MYLLYTYIILVYISRYNPRLYLPAWCVFFYVGRCCGTVREGGTECVGVSLVCTMDLDAATVKAFERACSEDNRQCVAAKQYFDDWVRALPVMVRSHNDVCVTVEHLPGMTMGSAYAVKVVFEHARLGPPVSINKGGDVDNLLTPTRARLENLTYASPLYVSLRVESQAPSPNGGAVYKGSSVQDVFLGTVPLMVGSSLCSTRTRGPTKDEIDCGGYFVVKGNEKVIPWFRATDVHSTVCYEGSDGEMFATVRSGVSYGKIMSTRLIKPVDTPAHLKFRGSAQVLERATPGSLLTALGVSDPVAAVFDKLPREDAAFYGRAAFVPTGEDADGDVQMGEHDEGPMAGVDGLFPGTAGHLKANATVSFLRLARYMWETGHLTDRDSLQSQQLDGVREILGEVFHKAMRATVKQLKQKLQSRLHKLHKLRHDRKQHRAATLEMPTAAWVGEMLTKHNSVSPGLHYFCATGNLQGGSGSGRANVSRTRTGCCQILERTSFLQTLSCMNKVVTPLDAQAAPVCARRFRLDFLGYICPVATPEGQTVSFRPSSARNPYTDPHAHLLFRKKNRAYQPESDGQQRLARPCGVRAGVGGRPAALLGPVARRFRGAQRRGVGLRVFPRVHPVTGGVGCRVAQRPPFRAVAA